MKLTEQQLFDYIYCPIKYYLKYEKKIIVEEEITTNKLLNKIAKYFYTSVVNEKLPTLNQMKSKLDSICEQHKDIITPKKSIEMWGKVYSFYNWACDNKISVIDANARYVINVGEHILEGTMNPINIVDNQRLESLIINFSNRIPDQLEVDTKLKYTIDTIAFNNSNEELKIIGTKIHLLQKNKDIITMRNETDFKRLKSTVSNVAKSIENKLYYPRETHMCTSCNYRAYCRAWH